MQNSATAGPAADPVLSNISCPVANSGHSARFGARARRRSGECLTPINPGGTGAQRLIAATVAPER